MSTRFLPHLAARVLNVPLMVYPPKLETVMAILGPRIGLEAGSSPFVDLSGEPVKRENRLEGGVAVIDVVGTLVHETNGAEAFSGLLPYQAVARDLEAALADPQVRGILLRVNSPGGECAGAWDLADAVAAAGRVKPLAAVACDMAASAAYLVASAAPQLFVTQSALVGSIGVITKHYDQTAMMDGIGVKVTEIYAGARKADMSMDRPLDEPARAEIQRMVDSYYATFVGKVSAWRGLAPEAVRATEARVYRGEEAVALGLADAVFTEAAALDWLTQRAGAGATPVQRGKEATMTQQNQPAPGTPGTAKATGNEPAATDKSTTVTVETEEEEIVDAAAEDMPAEDEEDKKDEEEPSAAVRKAMTAIAAKWPKSVAAFRREGARAERQRIKALDALALPGDEAVIADCKAKGHSVERSAFLLAEARKARKEGALKNRQADATQPLPPVQPAQPGPAATGDVEADAKAAFARDPKLKAEFGNEAAYVAFAKASAAQRVRIKAA
jgi:signal peptide peptidase SppA